MGGHMTLEKTISRRTALSGAIAAAGLAGFAGRAFAAEAPSAPRPTRNWVPDAA